MSWWVIDQVAGEVASVRDNDGIAFLFIWRVWDGSEAMVFAHRIVGKAISDASGEGAVVEVQAGGVSGEFLRNNRSATEADPGIDKEKCDEKQEPKGWRCS